MKKYFALLFFCVISILFTPQEVQAQNENNLIEVTINHYVNPYQDTDVLFKKEIIYLNEGSIFDPKQYYLDFSYTEWDSNYSYNDLDNELPFEVHKEDSHLEINYYYLAEIESTNLIEITMNHYVDPYQDFNVLYKKEILYLPKNSIFDPKQYYLDFSYTEWNLEYSYNDLKNQSPFELYQGDSGLEINYYYLAEIEINKLVKITINHLVDPYQDFDRLYKKEIYYLPEGSIFDPANYFLDFSYTEWDSEYSYNNLENQNVFKITQSDSGLEVNYYYRAEIWQ